MKRLKITFNAPVTLGFALISLAVLGLNILTRGRSNSLLFSTYHSSLLSPLTYMRFFTHVLGHSGWQHYAGNMMYILLASFTGFHDGEIPLSFILIAIIFIGQQVVDGIFVRDNVSNLSHIIGGVVGSVIGYNVNKK